MAREIASAIVAGDVPPCDGALAVARISPELSSLNVFAGLASEWEDDFAHRTEYEQAIREEAVTIAET